MQEMNEEIDSPHEDKQTKDTQQSAPINEPNQRIISFQRTLLLIITISLSSFYFGYTIIYLNTIQFDTIVKIYSITTQKSQALGYLSSCVQFGGLIGSLLSSYFIKNISRRNSILYISYAALTVGFLLFFADLRFLMFLRVCQGVCAGLFSAIVPLIIKEFAPFELSGFFGTFQQLFITIGIFSSCFLSYLLSKIYGDPSGQSYWKIVFGFPLLTLSVQTFALHYVFPFETPSYLIFHNREEEARATIAQIYKSEYVDQVMEQYKRQNERKEVQSSSSGDQKNELKITKAVSIHLAILQQFVGISAVATYAGQIASGNLEYFRESLPSIVNFQQVVTAIVGSFLLKKYGRKLILQYGTLGAVVTNVIIGFGFLLSGSSPGLSVALILIGLFAYMANFGLSLGPIVWMYIPEIVSPSFLPYSTMANWLGAVLSILLFPIIKDKLPNKNPALLFFFFAIWSIVSFFVNKKVVIETRNKSESQIKDQYRRLEVKYCEKTH